MDMTVLECGQRGQRCHDNYDPQQRAPPDPQMQARLPHEYVLVRRQASLYLPLLIILHATSYMVFSPGDKETR